MRLATGLQAPLDIYDFWCSHHLKLKGEAFSDGSPARSRAIFNTFAEKGGWPDVQLTLAIHRFMERTEAVSVDAFMYAMRDDERRDELTDRHDLVAEAEVYLMRADELSARQLLLINELRTSVDDVIDYRAAWGPQQALMDEALERLAIELVAFRRAA